MTGGLCFGQYGEHRKSRLDFMESDTGSGAVEISKQEFMLPRTSLSGTSTGLSRHVLGEISSAATVIV